MYLESLESYMEDLSAKMQYSKANSDLNAERATEEEQMHPKPKLASFICPYGDAEYILIPLRGNSKNYIGSPA